ncbi:YtxH domain-containing protein [Sinosporangium siamense]|uniref:YtxH domain-containing protein n=1 Tax=Sinosporangium siamense TaxID=1367973 RepID=A0A919R9S5_9ACTN|nr:YtxH domain-containing protein [Sinosporangium siamense]GII90021.1 hypothetical protein Ssi02_02520 [Sinosporangium siamense]
MRYRITFAAGVAIGYVLGSRAGHERYEQLKRTARRVADNPSVQEAAGLMGAQVARAAGFAKSKLGEGISSLPFLRPHDQEDETVPLCPAPKERHTEKSRTPSSP